MNKFYFYFILFLIYSFIGWAMEVCVTFPKYKKFVNRGFMLGPYCPIYGYSSIIMILYLNHYKDNPLTVFLLAVVVCFLLNIWLVMLWKRYLRLDGGIILIESLILMEEFVLIMLSSLEYLVLS